MLAGCSSILLTIYGIRNPRVETEASIKAAAKKYKLDTSNIAMVANSTALLGFLTDGIPNAAIYDSGGNYIEYRLTDSACNAGLFTFIPNLNPGGEYVKPDTLPLSRVLLNLRQPDSRPVTLSGPADFYILIFWSAWTGKLNKTHVKPWEDLVYDNPSSKIEVLKDSLDIPWFWSEEEKSAMIDAFKN